MTGKAYDLTTRLLRKLTRKSARQAKLIVHLRQKHRDNLVKIRDLREQLKQAKDS